MILMIACLIGMVMDVLITLCRNTLCVIDWKTSSKPKPLMSNLYDNPLQVVAYLGAINLSANFTSKVSRLGCQVILS